MLRKLLTFISLLGIIGGLQSQASQTDDTLLIPFFEERPIKAKLYGVNDGLSQGLIYSMTLDHYGRLWLSTKDGLNCYNGQEFLVFRKEQGNENSAAHDQVKSLSTDSLGRLWLVYSTGLIGLFDPATQSFSLPMKMSNGNMRFEEIIQMNGGSMLLRNSDTTKTEAVYSTELPFERTEKLRFKKRLEPIYGSPVLKALYDRNKCIVQQTNSGVIWLATTDSILRYGPIADGTGPVWTRFSMPQEKSDETERYVNFIADVQGTDAFVVDSSLVLHKYNITSNEFLPLLRLPEGTDLSGGSYLDKSVRLYLFHDDAEFLRINTRDTTCERLIPQWNRDFLSLNLQMGTALEDAQGNIWIGTPGAGVVQVSCSNDRFVAFNHPYQTYENGIYKYRTETPGKIHHFDPSLIREWEAYRRNQPGNLSFAGFVRKDDAGFFWSVFNEAETFNLARIDKSQKLKNPEIWLSEPAGAHWFGRHFFIGKDGKLWVNVNMPDTTRGLQSIHPLTGETEYFAIPPMPADDDYAAISDWYETPEGNWWLACTNGLFYFNPKNGSWKHFRNSVGESTSLSGNLLLSICPDPSEPQRYLWIGTEGAGLNRFDLRDSTFQSYTTDQGLPNNVIYGILPDSHHNLWISTNQGISHYFVQEDIFLNYTVRDGLAGNEFNRYEYATAPDGSLYFGGTAGLTIIQPEVFYNKQAPSTTLITGMKLQNKPVHYQAGSAGILEAPLHASSHLELPYDHRMFSFNFANLDLSNPEENEFRYMLEGFDQSWIDAGTDHEATYTNLNPGKYRFKVLGRNNFKVWNESPTALDITILAPWWGTWWFRISLALLVMSLLWGLYKYRVNSILEVERMRNQIAQDLHDEIGSTLSSISLYSTVMKKTAIDISPKSQNILDRIIHNVSDIMEKMNDMVWTIKSDNDSMEQVVSRMRAFAAEMAEAKNITLDFQSEVSVSKINLAMDKRKEIYLIFKEAVNNAVKYSAASKLSVRLNESEGKLKIAIRDDGKGFDLKNLKEKAAGGNGLTGMQRRAERIDAEWRIDSKLREGTTVYLSLPINH